jgi:hypothetical protein
MTKIEACHIERSRNAIKNDISSVFDCAQTDISMYFDFCHVLKHNILPAQRS